MKTVTTRNVLKASGRPNSTLLNTFVLLCECSIGPFKASKLRFNASIGFAAPWWPNIKIFCKSYLGLFLPALPRSCAGAGQLEQIQDLVLLLLLILLLLHKQLSNTKTEYISDSCEQNGLKFRQAWHDFCRLWRHNFSHHDSLRIKSLWLLI